MKRFLVIALLVSFAATARGEVVYEVVDLAEVFEQVVPSAELIDTWGVRAIADDGTMLGVGRSSDGKTKRTFLWLRDGSVTLLPELNNTIGVNISGSGIIVGGIPVGGRVPSYMWTSDGVLELLPEPAGSNYTIAAAVNDAGTVVGEFVFPGSEPDDYCSVAGMWRDGSYVELGVLEGGYSAFASAINNAGQVVGSSTNNGPHALAFLWDEENGMQYLSGEGVWASNASDINNAGQIVGFSRALDQELSHATLWDDGTLIDIHDVGRGRSWADAINSSGQVLGRITLYTGVIAGTLSDGTPYEETIDDLFLWDEEHGMRLLSDLIPADSDWTPRWAYDIGEDGTIACAGSPDAGGALRPYLLRPIPEPGMLPLICIAVGVCLRLRYR